MQCQRCLKKNGEYLCSVCERIVCEDCKVINTGKVYCLDHSPVKGVPTAETEKEQAPIAKPQFKTVKDIIYADVILLLGVIGIFYVSTNFINGMIMTNLNVITGNIPQLKPVFTLLTYFNSFALYLVIILALILITSVVYLLIKKRQYKNI
jgi:hypothetical protein